MSEGSTGGTRPLRSATPGAAAAPGRLEFLTVAEVAARMRVSRMTVYRLVHSGELSAVRVGRSYRVPAAAVEDYLRAGLTGSA